MGTLNVGAVNASTLDASAALNFPSYSTGSRPSSGIETGATIYNTTTEKLQTWNGSEWMDIGGGSEPDGSSADKAPYHFQGKTSTWMLVSLICLYMFLTYATTSISYYAPFCMEHFGMSTTEVGIVTAMYYLMCAVCGAFVSPLKRFFGKNTLFISLALCALGLFGIGFTHNFWIYVFSSLVTGFGYGIIQPIIYNKTTYVAPNRKLGVEYFGYVLSANYVSIMMVPFVDSAARKIFHSTLPTFEFIFSGAVVCVLLIWAILKRKNYVFAINPDSAAPTPTEIADAKKEVAQA